MGHQDSPSRVMARCKWSWEIILTVWCVGPWRTHMGVITGAWHRGQLSSTSTLTRPQTLPPTHTHKHIPPSLTAWPSSSGSIYTSPMPGIQDCLATRVSKGSDQRGAWKMVWVIWNKDTARTRVIWGRVMVSQGNPRPATRLLH